LIILPDRIRDVKRTSLFWCQTLATSLQYQQQWQEERTEMRKISEDIEKAEQNDLMIPIVWNRSEQTADHVKAGLQPVLFDSRTKNGFYISRLF
jgi:hypothetical protein